MINWANELVAYKMNKNDAYHLFEQSFGGSKVSSCQATHMREAFQHTLLSLPSTGDWIGAKIIFNIEVVPRKFIFTNPIIKNSIELWNFIELASIKPELYYRFCYLWQ